MMSLNQHKFIFDEIDLTFILNYLGSLIEMRV